MVTLESIIEQCYQFFEAKLLCIPNKDTIGKLMQPLFSAVPCLLCENGKKCVAYKKVQLRPEAQDGVVLPNYCELKKMSYNVLKFDMPLMMVLDGHIQKCEISFDNEKVTLQIRNAPFHISFGLLPTQKHVDGIIHLVTVVKTCHGVESLNDTDLPCFDSADFSTLHDENRMERRIWSKSCRVILNWTKRNSTCEVCRNSILKNRKRKNENAKTTSTNIKQIKTSESNTDPPKSQLPYDSSKEPQAADDLSGTRTPHIIELSALDHDDMTIILNKVVENGVPEKFKVLLDSQLKSCRKGIDIHQRRWNTDVITICLSLYIRSPKGYQDLQNSGLLVLPSQRLLRYYKNSIRQSPGFNSDNLQWMTKEATRQQISHFGMNGGIIIDEMSIQDDLVIQKKGDSWTLVGFVDMDTTNNNIAILCQGEKKATLATHVLQLVFHGLTGFRYL